MATLDNAQPPPINDQQDAVNGEEAANEPVSVPMGTNTATDHPKKS